MKYKIICPACHEVNSQGDNSSRVQKDDSSTRPAFSVNRRMLEGFINSGNGHAAMEKWGESVGMHVMSRSSFQENFKKILLLNAKEKEEILKESRAAVRRAHQVLDPTLTDEDVLDIAVSYDRSWQKRGNTALFGIGVVVDLLTGIVVDYFVASKYCHMCAITKVQLDPDSPEYHVWEQAHKEHECFINYSGPSGGMEQYAATKMWQRSLEYLMRFLIVLCDGDSKTFSKLNDDKPYGDEVEIQKEECVNHVSKRLSTALDKLPAAVKTKH